MRSTRTLFYRNIVSGPFVIKYVRTLLHFFFFFCGESYALIFSGKSLDSISYVEICEWLNRDQWEKQTRSVSALLRQKNNNNSIKKKNVRMRVAHLNNFNIRIKSSQMCDKSVFISTGFPAKLTDGGRYPLVGRAIRHMITLSPPCEESGVRR